MNNICKTKSTLTEKFNEKASAAKIAGDEGIQMAIHDAIQKEFPKAHEDLTYHEYYDLFSAVAKQLGKNVALTGKMQRVINKILGL